MEYLLALLIAAILTYFGSVYNHKFEEVPNAPNLIALFFGTFILSATAINFLETRNTLFLGQNLKTDSTLAELDQKKVPMHASYDQIGNRIKFKITYPSEMVENETKPVSLNFDRSKFLIKSPHSTTTSDIEPNIIADLSEEYKVLDTTIIFSLSSPAFEISPDQVKRINKGNKTPITQTWLINPKSEGNHILLVDLSDVILNENESDNIFMNSLVVNNNADSLRDGGIIMLPIKVYTIWNISRRLYEIIIAFFTLIGFILMLPFLQQVTKKIFGRKSQEQNPTSPTGQQSTAKNVSVKRKGKKKSR